MAPVLIVLSSFLAVVCVIPYVADIVRGRTKPRLVTWFTWALLSAITAAAALEGGHRAAAALTGASAAASLLVVVIGWKYGNRYFTRLDMVCQAGAILGLLVWWLFDSPALAIVTTTAVDFIGSIPTLAHSWKHPCEETWSTYLLTGVAGMLTLLAAETWQIASVLAPAYLLCFNSLLTVLILLRRRYVTT